jgi:RNA polymerase sigma-70 factor (ECF subfamily)
MEPADPDPRPAELAAALARCARGDRAALQLIYTREAARMIGVARRILQRQDLAEEAVHEAFLRIWRGAGSFDPARGSAPGWLYAVVRHCALDLHRSEKRYVAEEDDGSGGDGETRAPTEAVDHEAAQVLARLPETSALRRCLERLDRRRRSVLVLAYVHGLSHGELAGRLRLPLGTVKSWVRRSLFALQECMG